MVKVNVIGAIGPFPFPPTQRALWVGVGLPPALPPISRIRAPPEIGEMGGLQSGKPLGGKPLGGSTQGSSQSVHRMRSDRLLLQLAVKGLTTFALTKSPLTKAPCRSAGVGFSVVLSGNGAGLGRFCGSNPSALLYFAAVGLLLGLAVLCYTKIIEQAGSVTAVTVATVRTRRVAAGSSMRAPVAPASKSGLPFGVLAAEHLGVVCLPTTTTTAGAQGGDARAVLRAVPEAVRAAALGPGCRRDATAAAAHRRL